MDLSPYRIAVIDDSQTVRAAANAVLARAGATVVEAQDGYDGLAVVVAQRPDLVLVDIMMPRLDGLQLTALLRGHAEFAQLPVLLVSSKDSLFDQARGRLSGADGYLIKPFSAEELLAAVGAALIRPPHAGSEPQRENSADNPADNPTASPAQ